MDRKDLFDNYIIQNDNKLFSKKNIPLILKNLDSADKNNCLKEFITNKKPYFCFFQFVSQDNKASGLKDCYAIVLALNIYGGKTPGFAERLNAVLKELANGNARQVHYASDLMKAQIELQASGISLINFVDRDLLLAINNGMKKSKKRTLLIKLSSIFGGIISFMLFFFWGLFPISILFLIVFFYGFSDLTYWLRVKPVNNESIQSITQPIGICTVSEN